MGIVLGLLFASALLGLAAGMFVGGVLAVELATILIAFVGAFVLQSRGFDFVGGAIAIVAALFLNQLAFLAGILLRPRVTSRANSQAYGLMGEVRDEEPRPQRDQPVNDNQPEHDKSHPPPPSPPGQ